MADDTKDPKEEKAELRTIRKGDSVVTITETRFSKDEGLAKGSDREWLLFEAADKETLKKEDVILTIEKLEKQLRPLGIILKTWAKPGIKS